MSYTHTSSGINPLLCSRENTTKLFSFDAEVEAAFRFEGALAKAQSSLGIIPQDHGAKISAVLETITIDKNHLIDGVNTDGIFVPAFVKQVCSHLPEELRNSFHNGTTSQDVIDTSLMLRMKANTKDVCAELLQLCQKLEGLKANIGNKEIPARTRMQAALPFQIADRIDNWSEPIADLAKVAPEYFPVQLGGPIGMMHKQQDGWQDLVNHLADNLSLSAISRPWHTNRHTVIDQCSWLSSVTTALGKIGADIALMAQNGIDEITLKNGGSSSAMPHKNNPILAEILIASARYSAAQMGLLHASAVHEQERSGTSWTLEFATVPQIALTTRSSVANASRLIDQLC